MNKILVFCMLVCVLTGCVTSTDPREGGLVGYWLHKDEYQERIEERQKQLTELQEEGDKERQRVDNLEDVRARLQAELDQQRTMLSALESELAELQMTLSRYQSETAETAQEKQRVEGEITRLQEDIVTLRKNTDLSIKQREQEIEILNKELETLLEIAASL